MIPDSLTVPATVLGMAVLSLLVASLYRTYQRAQAERRMLIQRQLAAVQRNEAVLAALAAVNLPRDVRILLRRDTLGRLQRVRALYRSAPGLAARIAQARDRLDAEAPDAGSQTPVPPDAGTFDQWQHGFADLLATLHQGGLLAPPDPAERRRLAAAILERQAECLFGHFMHQADKLKGEDRKIGARSQLQQLIDWIRALGVQTSRTEDLIRQADEAYQYLLKGTVPKNDAAVS